MEEPCTVDNLLKLSRRLARALAAHSDPLARDLNAAIFRLDRCLSSIRNSYAPPTSLLWIDDVGAVLHAVLRHLEAIHATTLNNRKHHPSANYSTTMSSSSNTDTPLTSLPPPHSHPNTHRLAHHSNSTVARPRSSSTASSQQRRTSLASLFSSSARHVEYPVAPAPATTVPPTSSAQGTNTSSRRLFSSFSRLMSSPPPSRPPPAPHAFLTAARTVDEWVAAVVAARDDHTDRDADSCISLSDALPPLPQQYAPCRDAVYHAARDALLNASLRLVSGPISTSTSNSTSQPASMSHSSATRPATDVVEQSARDKSPASQASVPVPPRVTAVALVGPHGVGKTMLAMELVQDMDVCHNFADGVAWIQLGPDITDEELADTLIRCVDTIIAGDFRSSVRYCDSLDAIVARASRLLRHVSALVVIDDVSGPRAQRAFDIAVSALGPSSVALYTQPVDPRAPTASEEVVQDGVKCVARLVINPLEPVGQESATVFRSWLTSSTSEESRDGTLKYTADQETIVARCHGLPLALAMAAGFLSKFHDSWNTLAAALASCDSADETINRIMHLLHCKGGARFEAQLRAIGSLPLGVWVSLSTLADVWNIDYRSIKLSARRLGRMAFGEYRLSDSSDDSRVRFHWHISQYCQRVTSAADEREVNRRLLANIARRRAQGRKLVEKVDYLPWWSGCVLDKYMCRRLHWHMLRGDMLQGLTDLIVDYQWVCHRLEKDSLLGVITEFTLAMVAEEHNGRPHEATGIAQILEVLEEAAELRGEEALEMNALPTFIVSELEGQEASSKICRDFLTSVYEKARRPWLRPIAGAEAPPSLSVMESLSSDSLESEAMPYLVNCLTSSASGKVVCGDRMGNIHVYDPATGKNVVSWTSATVGGIAQHRGVGALATIHDNVISGHFNGRILLRSIRSGRCEVIQEVGKAMEKVTALATSECGMIAVGTNAGRLFMLMRVRDFDSKIKRVGLEGHCGMVTSLYIFPDGERIASSSYDGFAAIWRLRGSGPSRVSLNGHKPDIGHKENYITTFAAIHGGKRVLSSCRGGVVSAWSTDRGECLWTRRYGFEFSRSLSLQAFGLWQFGSMRDSGRDRTILRVGYPYVMTRGEGPCDLLILAAGEGREVLATVTTQQVISTWLEVWHAETQSIFVAVSHTDGKLSTYELVTSLK